MTGEWKAIFWNGITMSIRNAARSCISGKSPFTGGDTYVIDYACQDDELIGLLTVIAIDAANCSDGNR